MSEERKTKLLVSFDAQVRLCGYDEVQKIRVENLTTTWIWDATSRETAEYWACVDWLQHIGDYDWFSVTSWTGTPVEKAS